MQALGLVTKADLLQKGQEALLKLEAYVNGSWVDFGKLYTPIDLVGWWAFDEGAGMTAYDHSKEKNHGTLENMTEEDWVDGVDGKALEFDGVNDYVDCGTGIIINPGDDFSYALWVRIDDLELNWQVVMSDAATSTNHALYAIHNRKPFYYFGSFFYGDTWTTTGWHYLAITKKGNVHQLYQDGIPTTSYTEAEIKTLTHLYVGKNKYYKFTGGLDEIRVYKRALTAAEVKALFELKGKNYLESVSVSHGGAGMSPDPIAASLSAQISNEGGIFHPKHPTSGYIDYFKAGRKVRISAGAKYNGVDYYWQRIIGYIDTPDFSLGKTFTISIKGLDYTKLLADTVFKKTAVPPDNYWGTLETLDSVPTTQYGPELYDPPGGDAAEIGGGEADNVLNWDVLDNGGTAITSELDIGGFSDFEIKFVSDPVDVPGTGRVWYEGVCDVVAGQEYYVTFKYARIVGDANLRFFLLDGTTIVGGSGPKNPSTNGVFHAASFSFTPEANGTLDLRLTCRIGRGDVTTTWRVDQISIKSVTENVIKKYQMPEECTGIHYVELDEGEGFLPVWPGRQKDGEEGWFYDSVLQQFYFAEGKIVEAGTANLKIYYYTQQVPEEVVADILVNIGLYAEQATALATMEYTATGEDELIDQVWFKAGSKYLNAVKMICERCDYRFYFKWDGTPVFKPFPFPKYAGSEDMEFRKWHISDPKYYAERGEIRNRIVIEGLKQALPEGADETMPSELKGEAYDQPSIDEYKEHVLSINNHLFQTQVSIDAMKAKLLARYKDPKWYLDFKTEYNPAPLEIWDTIKAELMLKGPGWPGRRYGTFKYSSGVLYGGSGTLVDVRGLLRDIKIDKHAITYKNEEVL